MKTPLIVGLAVLGIILVVLLALVVLAVFARLVLHALKGRLTKRIAARHEESEILMRDLGANSLGLESAGVWQVRGNGALVLTDKNLHFFMFLPRRDISIPLDAITELTLTKSHLGKATVHDVLKVQFMRDGKPDSIAWYMTNPQAWRERIEELRGARRDNSPALEVWSE